MYLLFFLFIFLLFLIKNNDCFTNKDNFIVTNNKLPRYFEYYNSIISKDNNISNILLIGYVDEPTLIYYETKFPNSNPKNLQ